MIQATYFLGIDISKETFDVYDPRSGHLKYANDKEGFKELAKSLDVECCCVMESTGSYFQQLAKYLHERDHVVSVVNPMVIKRFIQMKLCRVKTDKSDAKMIARYACEQGVEMWRPTAEYIDRSKEIYSIISTYTKQRTALKNKLHSLESKGLKAGKLVISLKRQIRHCDKELDMLELLLEEEIKTNAPAEYTNLRSIPGIGKKTALLLITSTNGFTTFDHPKQLIAYFGLAPNERSSGSSIRGKTRISKAGDSTVRNHLFLCSFTACIHNPQCERLYNRLVSKSKSKKLALIAVCNKLLRQSYGVVKSGIPYDKDYKSRLVISQN